MRLFVAFFSVILIWSTTPLAIKWSGEEAGFLFGVTSRMTLGTLIVLLMQWASPYVFRFDRQARTIYTIGAVNIYIAMILVYWGAQYISSGMVSLIFGLMPFTTGIFAYSMIREQSFTRGKTLGLILGLCGLALVFSQSLVWGQNAWYGVILVLVSTIIQSVCAVLLRRETMNLPVDLPALTINAGSLLFALPPYVLTWAAAGAYWPQSISNVTLYSILYLAVIATGAGFMFYFYALKHLPASTVSLLTLITPVLAVLLGYFANNEPVTITIATGAFCTLTGLIFYQWGDRLWRRKTILESL